MSTNGDNGSRTHEPSLREVVAELDGLRDLMKSEDRRLEQVMDERDARYMERSNAAEKQVGVAFTASEKAAAKTEQAQDVYNRGHNDLLRKMDDQHKDTLPREEANAKFDSIGKEIQGLREFRSGDTVRRETRTEDRGQGNADRLVIVTLIAAIAGVGATFIVTHH